MTKPGDLERVNPGSLWEAITRAKTTAAGWANLEPLLEAAAGPRDGETWQSAKVRLLRLVLDLGDAAAASGVDRTCVEQAVVHAAGQIAVAAGREELTGMLRGLARTLAEDLESCARGDTRAVQRATAFIRANYRRPLRLEDVSRHVRLSPAYLSALFKREQGLSFVRYLRRVRLAEAMRLLCQTDLAVQEVANAVGFEDVHYFSRVFHREVGVPPRRYRERHG